MGPRGNPSITLTHFKTWYLMTGLEAVSLMRILACGGSMREDERTCMSTTSLQRATNCPDHMCPFQSTPLHSAFFNFDYPPSAPCPSIPTDPSWAGHGEAGTQSKRLLPVQSLHILLGEAEPARWAFSLTRSDTRVETWFTESYDCQLLLSDLVGPYRQAVSSLCIHLTMTCCLKFCSQHEHRRSF